jgi:hypothetical protein
MSVNKENVFEKCNSERMCTWLETRVDSVNHSGKGLVPVYVLRPKAGLLGHTKMARVLYGVNYKQDRGDTGVLINYCPFCGQTPGLFAQEMKR